MGAILPSKNIYLLGPRTYLPPLVSNRELLERCGYTDGIETRIGWIKARSGIETRPWAEQDQATSDLAIRAVHELYDAFPSAQSKVGQLVFATISGDFISPPTAPLVQRHFNLERVGCFDLGAACAGFISGVYTASALTLANQCDTLVVSADIRSRYLNFSDLNSCILFGDAAAAAQVTLSEQPGALKILGVHLLADGRQHHLISIAAGGSRQRVAQELSETNLKINDGVNLFLKAVEGMEIVAKELIELLGLTVDQISWVAPHQANLHMIDELAKRLNKTEDQVQKTISRTGNLSGVSSAVTLRELQLTKPLKTGDKILSVAAGGGGLAAAAIFEVV